MRDREQGRFTTWVTALFGARPEEYTATAWSFTYFFCILGSYYMLRPVREAMAVASGPETIPYLFAGTFVAMLVATPGNPRQRLRTPSSRTRKRSRSPNSRN